MITLLLTDWLPIHCWQQGQAKYGATKAGRGGGCTAYLHGKNFSLALITTGSGAAEANLLVRSIAP